MTQKVLCYRSSYVWCLMFPGRFGATEADLGAGRPGSAHEDSVSSGGAAAKPPTSRSGPPTPGGLLVWSRLPSNKFRAGDWILLDLLFRLTLFSSINEWLQLYFRLFWKWREMNVPPSRARSKLIRRKANGCCSKQRSQTPPRRIDAPRTAQNVTERAKKSTFIYVKLVWVCGTFIRNQVSL